MPSLLDLAWLIPALPLLGASLLGVLLLSFSRTMNRLTKPSSVLLLTTVLLSAILSLFEYINHVSGVPFLSDFLLNKLNFSIYVDEASFLVSTIISSIFLLFLLTSFASLKRREGYLRYIISIGFLCSFMLIFVFSGESFHNVYNAISLKVNHVAIL